MADSSVAVTPGSGAPMDTRTESTNSNHRQVICVGDPDDNDGLAPVDQNLGLGQYFPGFGSVGDGAKTVASAGTAEQLAADQACKLLIMTAEDDNTGKIYYGGSGVSSTSGDYLFPAQKLTLHINNLNLVYIDADTSTDGVKFTYFA